MREMFTQVLGATRATASVIARDLLGFRAEDPLAERDPQFIRETLPGLGRLAQLYFRPKVRGLEQIPPQGPVLLVGNHSGGTLIADTFAFAYCFYDHFGPDRLFHNSPTTWSSRCQASHPCASTGRSRPITRTRWRR